MKKAPKVNVGMDKVRISLAPALAQPPWLNELPKVRLLSGGGNFPSSKRHTFSAAPASTTSLPQTASYQAAYD